jgi:hypothetical protein
MLNRGARPHSQSRVLHVGTTTVTDGLVGDAGGVSWVRMGTNQAGATVLTRTLRGSGRSSRA